MLGFRFLLFSSFYTQRSFLFVFAYTLPFEVQTLNGRFFSDVPGG